MHEHLTYGLDDANNRTTSSSQTGASPDVTTYTLQGSAHPQGPSNRYDTVSVPNATLDTVLEYDDRGNLTYDGRFVFKYDYMNRLQEVWRVLAAGQPAVGAERFAVVQQGALESAQEAVFLEVPDLYTRLAREHTDPVFRARLKATISGGVTRITPTAQSGGAVAGDLELVAVYLYDAFNRRTQSVLVGLETQIHTWDGWRQTAQHRLELVGSVWQATPMKQFVWGSRLDELVAYRRLNVSTWENYYLLHGGQDTAAKLVDSTGAVVEQYEYDPYGMATVYDGSGSLVGDGSASAKGLPFMWKSIRLDSETGLLYMRNRYYSTALGRFLTQDLLGTWADNMNLGCGYCYVGNMPGSFRDPLGLQAEPAPTPPTRTPGTNNPEHKEESSDGSLEVIFIGGPYTGGAGKPTTPGGGGRGDTRMDPVPLPSGGKGIGIRITVFLDFRGLTWQQSVALFAHEWFHSLRGGCLRRCLDFGHTYLECLKRCEGFRREDTATLIQTWVQNILTSVGPPRRRGTDLCSVEEY